MKKIIILSTIILFSSFVIKLQIRAQTEPSPTPDEKVQGIRDKVQEQVQEQLENIITDDQKRSWNGTVSSLTETEFEIDSSNQTRTITINEDTKIINQAREAVSFQELEEDQYILAMGYERVDESLNAKRIVITEPYQPRKKISVHGTVVNKASNEKIILIQNQEQEYELILDSNTEINQKTDSDTEKLEYEDLPTDQEVIAVIEPADGETASYTAIEILALTLTESPTPTPTE